LTDFLTPTTMPNVGLKEKSKRTTTRSPFENTTANLRPEDSDVEMGDETSSDEDDVPEKDEAEKKLERMLFGDDEGFMGALKTQQDREAGMALTLHSDDESDVSEDAEEGEDQDLAALADSDVCDSTPMRSPILGFRSNNSAFFSFSSLTPAHPPPPILSHRRKPRPRLRTKKRTNPQYGTIATTIASQCR
jgi:hypothetical protein